jgi:short-subunit dehydrogenase
MQIMVTGAAQGIGAAIAKHLANKENTLTLVDLNADKLSSFAAELRPNCQNVVELAGDLTDPTFLDQLRAYIQTNHLDVLINNAGYAHALNYISDLSLDDLELSFKVNVKAPFALIQAAVPGMKLRGAGVILNVASRANIYGYAKMAAYSATKAAVTSLNGTVALENTEIKSVTIIPGRTNTSMQANLRGADEAAKSQSPDYVGETVAKVVSGEIPAQSGDAVLIDFGEFRVLSELDKSDLHKHMH